MQKLLANALAGLTLVVSANAAADDPAPNTVVNFAFGGAQTGSTNLTAAFVPGLTDLATSQGLVFPGISQQLDWAEATVQDVESKRDLFWLYAGTNDLLGAVFTTPPGEQPNFNAAFGTAAANIAAALERLYSLDARKIVVPNLPPIGMFPILTENGVPAQALPILNYVTHIYNTAVLPGVIAQFQASHPDALVISVDIESVMYGVMASGAFTNTTESCLTKIANGTETDIGCNGYVFVDTVHPTEEVYARWADAAKAAIIQALEAAGQPGSASNLNNPHMFRRIVTIGDSFSDTGSFNATWNRLIPQPFLPSFLYTLGRFSERYGVIDLLEAGDELVSAGVQYGGGLNVQYGSSAYQQ